MKKLFVCIDIKSTGDYWDSVVGIFSAVSETAVYDHLSKEKNMTLTDVLNRYIATEVDPIKEI